MVMLKVQGQSNLQYSAHKEYAPSIAKDNGRDPWYELMNLRANA
jgi:hypothetical protein